MYMWVCVEFCLCICNVNYVQYTHTQEIYELNSIIRAYCLLLLVIIVSLWVRIFKHRG
jgi:hypothetical protein